MMIHFRSILFSLIAGLFATACAPVHGIVATTDQADRMGTEVLYAYMEQNPDLLVRLAPGKKDLKALRNAAGRPEGATELRLAKLPSAAAIEDSIKVKWMEGVKVDDWKGLNMKQVIAGRPIELKGLPMSWHPVQVTYASPGDVFGRKMMLMVFKGRCFLMSLEPVKPE